MLILDVLDDELGRAESLFADFAHVFLTFEHLFCLIKTVLVLHFDEKLILLRILQLLIGAFLEQLLSVLHIILFELLGGAIQG